MFAFANQGSFGVETDNNSSLCLILWIELNHILWIWWAKGPFYFWTKIRSSGHFGI